LLQHSYYLSQKKVIHLRIFETLHDFRPRWYRLYPTWKATLTAPPPLPSKQCWALAYCYVAFWERWKISDALRLVFTCIGIGDNWSHSHVLSKWKLNNGVRIRDRSKGGPRIVLRRGCTIFRRGCTSTKTQNIQTNLKKIHNKKHPSGGGAHPLHSSPGSATEKVDRIFF